MPRVRTSRRLNEARPHADLDLMSAERLVLVRGMRGTRATLDRWNLDPWPVVSGWLWRSLATAVALLAAVWVVAELSTPDATPLALPGVNTEATLADVGPLLWRNLLVLALHAMACVAGFIAGFSMPELAASRAGLSRLVHEKAGPAAIAFVVAATSFSLLTQAYALGHATATIALHTGLSPAVLLLALSLHAVPELAALFLPLAA